MTRAASLALALLFAAHLAAEEPKKDPPKPDNSIISALVDKPKDFKGKRLCLQLEFVSKTLTLDQLVGDKENLFTATDPNNGAKLRINLDLPKDLTDVPKARGGDQLVVVFECAEGDTLKGNKIISVARPPKKK